MTFGDSLTNLPPPRPRTPSLSFAIPKVPQQHAPGHLRHRRQKTSISLRLSEAVAAADVAHKPTLKTVGKSDCEVKIVKASECRILPEESGYSTPKRTIGQGSTANSPLLNFGIQRRANTPLLGRPGMETHYFALRGDAGVDDMEDDFDQDDFAHLPASAEQIRRLTSHMWAVRKTAFAKGKQNGSRLAKQIDKQSAFFREIADQPVRLAGITTPAVYSMQDDVYGNKIVEMAYCPFDDTLDLILKGDSNTLDWMARSIVTIVEHNIQRSDSVPYTEVASAFRTKAADVVKACYASPFLTAAEASEVEAILEHSMLTAETDFSDLTFPVGNCHGDLTLQNMLWDPSQRQMAVFDFLDCFVESPLQDIAKLFQDIRHYWFFTQKNVKSNCIARVLNVFCLVESAVAAAFSDEKWWPLVDLFDLFCLARVLPYVTEVAEKECLLEAIRKWSASSTGELASRNMSTPSLTPPSSSSTPSSSIPPSPTSLSFIEGIQGPQAIIVKNTEYLPPKKRSQVTLIVTALGEECGEVYPDGNPKIFTIHPSGSPMLVECMRQLELVQVDRVYIALSHVLVTNAGLDPEAILGWFDDLPCQAAAKIALVLFNKPTRDVVETVSLVIDIAGISGAIFVKDADNTFATTIRPANCITTLNLASLSNNSDVYNMDRKSYATFIYDNVLANVYENSYLSSVICVGGYGFSSARSFMNSSASLRDSVCRQDAVARSDKTNNSARLKISDVVFRQLLGGAVFFGLSCTDYSDWGSMEAWTAYMRSFRTVVFSADRLILKRFLNKSRGLQALQSGSDAAPDFANFLEQVAKPRSTIIVATKFPSNYLTMVRQYMACDGALSALGAESRVQFLHSYMTDASMRQLGYAKVMADRI